jgi:D-alanyl-D-alanine carboxypeptidase
VRAGRWRVFASAFALTCVAACGDGSDHPATPDKKPSPSASATLSESPTATPALDPDHVMEMPGPISGLQAPPDILIISTDTLPDSLVKQIDGLDDVASTESLSIAQTIIENEAVSVAAVDPATYRNYTKPRSAQTQAVWERVAGGELALEDRFKNKLPEDEDGFLTITSDAPAVHIGAYAPQVVQVDAVVNETWVDDLELTRDNALLVRTGIAAPKKVQKQIERLTGTDVSVQLVDLATRFGVDPGVKQVAVTTGTVADVVGVFRYTVIGGGRIAPEQAWVDSHIVTQQVPILGSVTCNKFLFPQLTAALQEIQDRGLADKIHPDEFAGCYYPRFIAGSTKLSNHSFGLALDLNVPGNQRGTVGEMDRGVVDTFKKWGFAWGGDWGYTDPMHFEMNRLVDPQTS